MKVRIGFVSNSSSSSYLVVGMSFTGDELLETFTDLNKLYDEYEDYLSEVAEKYFSKLGLSCDWDEEGEECLLGVYIGSTYNQCVEKFTFNKLEKARKEAVKVFKDLGFKESDIKLCVMGG